MYSKSASLMRSVSIFPAVTSVISRSAAVPGGERREIRRGEIRGDPRGDAATRLAVAAGFVAAVSKRAVGTQNASHAPRRDANASHSVAGATLAHPSRIRLGPAGGKRVLCVTRGEALVKSRKPPGAPP